MSDALSDIKHDKERCKLYEEFLSAIADYFENPTPELETKVKDAARKTDDVPRGYHDGPTNLCSIFDNGMWTDIASRKPEAVQRFLEGHKTSPHFPRLNKLLT